jgi:hypothetical protein
MPNILLDQSANALRRINLTKIKDVPALEENREHSLADPGRAITA